MSGSTRAITLTLSVRDADTVKRELERIGPAGETALARLEAAATRAAGRSGSGGMAQLATATEQAGNQFRGMGYKVGQAGFQIQDFAVQVQGGTSALTALSQQGSQLLGVFGTGGAIAGAILTVGILVTQLFTMGETAEQANKRIEDSFKGMAEVARDVTTVLRDINALFLTASQRAAAAANAQVGTLRDDTRRLLDVAIQRNEGNAAESTQAQRDVASTERQLAQLREANARAGRQVNPGLENILTTRLAERQARVAGLAQDTGRQSERIGELTAALARLENAGIISQGGEEFGPPAPERQRGGGGRTPAARLSDAERAANEALRERETLLRSLESPYDRYVRRLEELATMQERLPEASRLTDDQMQRATDRFASDLATAERTAESTSDAARELGMTFSSAFEDAIVKGEDLRKVLDGVAQDIARILLRQTVVSPLASAAGNAAKAAGSWIGSLLGGGSTTPTVTPSANGNAFAGGRLIPFASGGLIDRATVVPMALMGEAGPEAIMPLRRGKDGKLGVAAAGGGGGGVVQTINIDARGADPSVVPLIRAAMAQAKREAQAELLSSIQRGGQAAKIVGRRA